MKSRIPCNHVDTLKDEVESPYPFPSPSRPSGADKQACAEDAAGPCACSRHGHAQGKLSRQQEQQQLQEQRGGGDGAVNKDRQDVVVVVETVVVENNAAEACNGKEVIGIVSAKEFTNSVSSQHQLETSASPCGGQSQRAASELTLFPPLGTTLNQPGDRSSVVQFEPLPDIHVVAAAAAAAARRKPAAFGNTLHHGLSVHDWFAEGSVENFPRQQLQYLRELGRGWFGRVVEGKAKDIISGHATSKVIVKILHEDATPTDQSYFLHEAKPYKSLKHPNVLRLIGRCLETHPFLLLLEDCSSGTLKTFLTENRKNAEKFGEQGILLEMASGVAAGLHHMVENGFVHTDLAARNCLVSSDLTVKVGDYGTSIETFKDEYYCVGDLAIPIRWVAPETLHCTDTTIETKEVTASANVWSLSIVLWEICEFGKLPYTNLSDEEVIEQVLGKCSTNLPFPSYENQLHVHNLYHLMKICWVEAEKRPPLWRVAAMLKHLVQHKSSPAHTSANNNNNSTTSLDDFERRWELSKPNTVPKIDNQAGTTSMQTSPVKSVPVQRFASLEDNSASTAPHLELISVTERVCNSPASHSLQSAVSSGFAGDRFVPSSLAAIKSPSLQNLRGSVDELNNIDSKESTHELKSRCVTETVAEEADFDSWLKGMDTSTEEDVRFVRNISEAIRDLDEVLAQEKTSSSSQNSSAQPSPSQVTSRDTKPESTTFTTQDQRFTLDFRLGQAAAPPIISHNIGLLHSNRHESLSLSQHRLESSGSDTEDETWRIRIEKGEFSEKVKEKSKSVADLMVLTHIDYSDGSDSDTTLDLESCGSTFKKNGAGRRSFHRKPLQSSLSITYGSEGNIHQAVLGEEFQATIKRLQQSLRDGSKLEAIPDASLSCISMNSNEAHDNTSQAQSPLDQSHFLAKLASENKMMINDASENTPSNDHVNKLGEENILLKSDGFQTPLPNGEPMEMLETQNNGDTNFGSSKTLSASSHPSATTLSCSEDSKQSCSNSKEVHKINKTEEISGVNGHSNSVAEEKFLIASTPISCRKPTSESETFDMDSSLLCSQSLSLIESEKSDSDICSMGNRPPSPTPDNMEMKKDSSCVILGPFEDSTLDYFKGLKTSFPVMKPLDYDTTNEIDLQENSIETWDKFLDHAMQAENCDYPSFSDISFQKSESESPGSVVNAPSVSSDILGSSFERSVSEKLSVMSSEPNLGLGLSRFENKAQDDKALAIIHQLENCAISRIGLESQVSTDTVTTCEIQDSDALLAVPSVNVIAATPISSGRNTPYEVINSDIDAMCIATKETLDVAVSLEDKVIETIHMIGEDTGKVSQNSRDALPQKRFVVPEIKMSGVDTPIFDPDLPCCNQIDQDFVPDAKGFGLGNSAFALFSAHVDNPNVNFAEGIETGCYTSSGLDADLIDKQPVIPLFSKPFDSKEDANGEILEDDDEFGLGVAKNLTPDDERSSDSGFRDKGSLSESCEDACDEKYNLEDIEAELEEAFSKGVFARHDSPTSNKGLESDCEAVDESFSVTLTDVEKQRELREAEMNQSKDPCHRLDDLLRCDQIPEPLSVDVESSVDFFGASPALSPIPHSGGWYLHPPQKNEENNSEPTSGNDSSYFSFSLDEEFVNAIRNELREKLPCAQMQREEHQPQLSDEEENSDNELDSYDSASSERTNIMIHYKTYPAPLSPILEERESICSESYSPLGCCNSSSCSEQLSPVFAVDRSPSNIGDGDIRHVESECPAEVDGDLSDDCGDCGDFDEMSEHDVLPVDLKFNSPSSVHDVSHTSELCLNENDEDDDDVLVVNTETNEATLLESPKPTSKFSFGIEECDDSIHDDFVPDFLSVAGSYQLPETNFNSLEKMRSDLYLGNRPLTLATLPQTSDNLEFEDDNDSMTPDSITCEKSFSEKTEDSAVGLALSEVMTPDSLAGETQWTSTHMCDSGFGTIISTVSSSSGSSTDCSDKRPSEEESVVIEEDASLGTLPMVFDKSLTKEDDIVESSETTHSTEDSESSVSVSSHSVIAGPQISASAEELKSCQADHTIITDIKNDIKLLTMEDAKFIGPVLNISPQSLKEMAQNAVKTSAVQTLAFNNEDTNGKLDANIAVETVHISTSSANCSQNSAAKTTEDLNFENRKLQNSHLEANEPLQTLAFSDPDVIERHNFPGVGHIVVSSIIAPLTPSDDTLTPGTLAFNESPESPRDIVSPIFQENDETEAESHLMSTSFMSADEVYEDHDHFTPDWESGSDGCESETASSSSGEFIWKDGDRESSVKAVNAVPDSALTNVSDQQTYNQSTSEFPMSSIMEEEEDEEGSGSSSCTSDSEDDTEFVPSAWDSQATPSRSALRSPDKKVEVSNTVEQKKNVSFKRQRYHCVYEYPRELSDSDGSEFADSPSRRRTWDLENGTYNMHEWDLAVNEEAPCQDDTKEEQTSSSPSASQRLYEFYKLSSTDYGFGSSMLSEDGEFFISSSAQPFHTLGEAGPSGGSEFFPGRDLTVSSVDDGDVIDGPLDHNSVESGLANDLENQNWRHTEDFSDSDSSDTNMMTASEGSFNQHQSGDSNSSSTPMVTANGSSKGSEDSSIYHSLPSNQELQVDSGSDSPLSELSPTSPLSPSSPSHGLGELRHTRNRLKLDLPAANTTFVLVAPCKKRSVEQVKGEASLLDGEDGFKVSKSCVNETLSVSSNV
ncbi:Serine/threonine-protein kinase LMTK2 [Frankliniella fusca]|uniref:Serine/threonine-protein kinase LMTK2 n=1 Tax=Frankliniella fusca TaxID=407009 RepID=A0AAE1H255_9NEOP|nr:Serine/threonine-protein kinase LMTK2 [Frankliniella fusca]